MIRTLQSLSALLLFATCSPVSAQILVEASPLVLGEMTSVTVTDKGTPTAGVQLGAVYYPATEVEETTVVGSTDGAGRTPWTPQHAGLVKLTAGAQSTTVSVRYPSIPLSGLIVFFVAGSILLGGVALGATHIIRARNTDA